VLLLESWRRPFWSPMASTIPDLEQPRAPHRCVTRVVLFDQERAYRGAGASLIRMRGKVLVWAQAPSGATMSAS
jgi:hypothetical protein